MNIENQVCSAQQGRTLANLGLQYFASHFVWTRDGVQALHLIEPDADGQVGYEAPAFTASELGLMLPENVCVQKKGGNYECFCNKEHYPFPQIQEGFNWFVVTSDTGFAECMAEMLYYLLKAGFVKVDEVNERLGL